MLTVHYYGNLCDLFSRTPYIIIHAFFSHSHENLVHHTRLLSFKDIRLCLCLVTGDPLFYHELDGGAPWV